jgi:glucose-6-phosphate isomerase
MSSFDRFVSRFFTDEATGLSVDTSRISRSPEAAARMPRALEEMKALEAGAIANPDEGRMVGHYWLRDSTRAPSPEIRQAIDSTRERIDAFVRDVHAGVIRPERGGRFRALLVIGIGGSALGPELLADALGDPATDRMRVCFLDNTDPAGMARVLRAIGELESTLTLVISKSGGTPETRNGMLVARAAYEKRGLSFEKHAVAITGEGSALDRTAAGWIARFPMWDWVGGRTSVTSAVGLVPAALQGIDTAAFLRGAAAADALTRREDPEQNPAAMLAEAWYAATNGRGERDMVVLPYKDALLLFSRYLQQLVMESLGKEKDRKGNTVHQGIAVYGNKGSTDQHAYVQQLRDGVPNFFATFIEVLEDGGDALEVEPSITSGDYLRGFFLGTREALSQAKRESIAISLPRADAFGLGMLIALYERTVGLYASLVDINAYHQPGVEAGKKAASALLELEKKIAAALGKDGATAPALAGAIGAPDRAEEVFFILRALAANGRARQTGSRPESARFALAT